MVNTLKLRALLLENDLPGEKVADLLKISQQSFSMKINNKREFKASEIKNLATLLKLKPQEIMTIFFADPVEYNSTGGVS